jgi:hypothetical protein
MYEVRHETRGMPNGAFDPQRLERRVGLVDSATLAKVETAVRAWLSIHRKSESHRHFGCQTLLSGTLRGSELLWHHVGIAPFHLVEARLVNQALTLGEGRDQPSALVQHALIAQCAQRRLHALHRALKSCVGV